jgi:hypothetical protein
MTAWFARVGLPLEPDEEEEVLGLMRIVAPHPAVAVAALGSWQEVAEFVRAAERDPTAWDQEEEEREALWARATEQRTEAEVLRQLDAGIRGLDVEMRAAALAAAGRAGIVDAALATEATGMALLAAHQSALALLAGEGRDHRFVRKYALFTRGRWPLGYHSARFAIF